MKTSSVSVVVLGDDARDALIKRICACSAHFAYTPLGNDEHEISVRADRVDLLAPEPTEAFNVHLLIFTFEDTDVQDPTLSECGRFTVAPSEYGFQVRENATWVKQLENGDVLQLSGSTYKLIGVDGGLKAKAELSELDLGLDD